MIIMEFKTDYIMERNLIFGGLREEKDPRIGLKYFGPYTHESETKPLDKIGLGIIGDKSTLEKTKAILSMIKEPIVSAGANKWLYPDFPGISKDTKFGCDIDISGTWQDTILQSEIDSILKITNTNERIGAAVELYLTKIRNIASEDNPPSAILCCLPKEIEEHCGISRFTRGAKTPKPTELEREIAGWKNKQRFLSDWGAAVSEKLAEKPKGYDFRNALKGKNMGIKPAIPIQILRESTMDAVLNYNKEKGGMKQEPASFAWNFSTALFYKANGKPWRLAKLRDDTCYVGISFYRDKLAFNIDIQTSMAQVFTHDGQGLVLRGSEVYVDTITKEPHLSEKQAETLLKEAIEKYTEKAHRTPARVVIHKSTLFSNDEIKGLNTAIGMVKHDFVTISKRKGIRFMRMGSYPVLRGTLVHLTDKEHILFTSGYTPRIRTYPGHSIPQPLLITHIGDSEVSEICDEIIGLTKLNWNTTAFSTYLPITLEFSEKVGEILSEASKDIPLQPHYRFYM
jgi:hypothetical protein